MAAFRITARLPDLLRELGVPVVEHRGWLQRGYEFPAVPIGGMLHHWGTKAAGEDAVKGGHSFPRDSWKDFPGHTGGGLRTDGRVMCNIFSDRGTGTIHFIAAGYANYSSGWGNVTVFNEVRDHSFSGGTALSRGLDTNTVVGNHRFVNLEAEHAGDGSDMPAFQEQNIAIFWAVLLGEIPDMPLSAMQVIGHDEWTDRKIDPRWSGMASRMPVMRAMIQDVLDGAPEEENKMLPIGAHSGVEDVRAIQKMLNAAYGTTLKPTGKWDDPTIAAVKEWTGYSTNYKPWSEGSAVGGVQYALIISDMIKVGAGSGGATDTVARLKAADAHARLDKLHKV